MITTLKLSRSWRSFLYSYSVCSCHLFLISSTSVSFILFLFFIEPILALNVPLVPLKFWRDSSLSHSIVLIYFFALISEKGFLNFPGYSLKLCFQMDKYFIFSFAFGFSSFTAFCKAFSDSRFAFLLFFFLGIVLLPVPCTMPQTSVHSSCVVYNLLNARFE